MQEEAKNWLCRCNLPFCVVICSIVLSPNPDRLQPNLIASFFSNSAYQTHWGICILLFSNTLTKQPDEFPVQAAIAWKCFSLSLQIA
ncbi:hypothetical protein T02_6555 [Trichinella nativa]|uniref:Uncharacterized protein n=1 Tax=Trichinella nativa TaxID=6335 RepID=A0A0V1KT82_9BILA|nr:hypothetical protein T02_6555 [Trichinella nativa]